MSGSGAGRAARPRPRRGSRSRHGRRAAGGSGSVGPAARARPKSSSARPRPAGRGAGRLAGPVHRQVGVERLGLAEAAGAGALGFGGRAGVGFEVEQAAAEPTPRAGGARLGAGPTGLLALEPRGGSGSARVGSAGRGDGEGGGGRGESSFDQSLAEAAGSVRSRRPFSMRSGRSRAVLAAAGGPSASRSSPAGGGGRRGGARGRGRAGAASASGWPLVVLGLDVGDVEEAVAADREVDERGLDGRFEVDDPALVDVSRCSSRGWSVRRTAPRGRRPRRWRCGTPRAGAR